MIASKTAAALSSLFLITGSALGTTHPNLPLMRSQQAAKEGNEFGVVLYQRIAAGDRGNLFCSPTSIHTALGMACVGARGQTAEQMKAVLSLQAPATESPAFSRFGFLASYLNNPRKIDDKPAYQLSIANALWVQKGLAIEQSFTETLKTGFQAAPQAADFRTQGEAARKAINDWVEQQTKEKIKDLVPRGALNEQTRLVLANAIYFKSDWQHQFQASATRDEDFILGQENRARVVVKVPMMHQTARFGYLETDSFQAMEMPYKAGELSMIVLLPKEVAALAAFEKSLTAKALGESMDKVKPQKVDVTLPKFKFTSQFSLAKPLAAMGMADAFDPDKADFSGISRAEKLFISAVLHKAFVAVDENGTEAAAATAVMIGVTSVQLDQPKVFKADHPFVFLIRHRATGAILFMGRVANPKE